MSEEGSNSEHSFKNTAHNSAATFSVCVCKTESLSLVSYKCHVICILLTPLKKSQL